MPTSQSNSNRPRIRPGPENNRQNAGRDGKTCPIRPRISPRPAKSRPQPANTRVSPSQLRRPASHRSSWREGHFSPRAFSPPPFRRRLPLLPPARRQRFRPNLRQNRAAGPPPTLPRRHAAPTPVSGEKSGALVAATAGDRPPSSPPLVAAWDHPSHPPPVSTYFVIFASGIVD